MQLLTRFALGPGVGLGRQEEAAGLALQPGTDPQLGVAVTRGGIDVIDAMPKKHLERAVRSRLGDLRERGGAEDRAGAGVSGAVWPGPAEGKSRNCHTKRLFHRGPSAL